MAAKPRTKKLVLSCLACILAAACLLAGCNASPLPDPDDILPLEDTEEAPPNSLRDYGWEWNPLMDVFSFPTLEESVSQADALICGRITGEPSAFKDSEEASEEPYEPCDLEDPDVNYYQYTVKTEMDATGTYKAGEELLFSVPYLGGTVVHPKEGAQVILLLLKGEDGPGDLSLGSFPCAFSVDDSGHIKVLGIGPSFSGYVGLSAADFWQSLVDYRNGDIQTIPTNPDYYNPNS